MPALSNARATARATPTGSKSSDCIFRDGFEQAPSQAPAVKADRESDANLLRGGFRMALPDTRFRKTANCRRERPGLPETVTGAREPEQLMVTTKLLK